MRILLVSPYELGRQPFSLAHPAALLRGRGHSVVLADLTLGSLPWEEISQFDLIGISLGMHTATRIAASLLPQLRARAKNAQIICYGVYGPPNAQALGDAGADVVLGPEFEGDLLGLVATLGGTHEASSRVEFVVPDRTGLPSLGRYAHLVLPDEKRKTVGFVEGSRGCKYFCRHCPIVPVYEGRFRAIPRDTVIADASQQIALGATHLSFGDPDFLNGPTHALRILETLHSKWPHVTFDATIKISHILAHKDLIPLLREYGCLFITSAAESFDDAVLEFFDKGHTGEDIAQAVAITRASGIALTPTFVPFTPWTSLDSYLNLLTQIRDLALINSVTPIQLVIRLLIPKGSYLLRLPDFEKRLQPFAAELLGYPWVSSDPRVDILQARAQRWIETADQQGYGRFETFAGLWTLAHEAVGRTAPSLDPAAAGPMSPHLSEPWYCCAEPTTAQLAAGAAGG
ncbi:MAG: CUAEP/CCAEP-tail radical SAM (seleno)protein [Acidiferrobacter sp.]